MTALCSGGKSSTTVRQIATTSTRFILMPEPVADAADIAPGEAGAEDFGVIAETDRGFADHLQFALNGSDGFGIGSESCLVHIACELLDFVDRLGNVP